MVQILIAASAICVLVVMSVRASRRFKHQDRLPMQWSLDGSVNWTAPRSIALAFTPLMAVIILPGLVALTTLLKPRAGQEGFVIPSLLFVALVFVGVHAFHIWFIGKSLNQDS